jgi:hypothetical protein
MCSGPHSANLLYLAMGLRLPCSEYSPKPPPEGGRCFWKYDGASKEVTMEIIGEYLKPLAGAADDSEENFLGLVTYRPDSTRPRIQNAIAELTSEGPM